MTDPGEYPNISDILAAEAATRQARSALSFGAKIAWVEKAPRALAPIHEARRRLCETASEPDATR